ncbi:MAG: hypothetical protein J2P51_01140 [Hyphomicrobiaceae bacterium]|nr:hypothetical protein [Hyphomicrobiaceae bacterium]
MTQLPVWPTVGLSQGGKSQAGTAAGAGSGCAATKGRKSVRRKGNCRLQVRKSKTRPKRFLDTRMQDGMDNGAAMVKLGKDRGQVERPGHNLAQQGGGSGAQGKMEQKHA